MKIATHNSITGERGTFLSSLLTLFARCQNKSLVKQYNAGCRMFDIRIVKHKNNFYGAHGLWRTQKPIFGLLLDLYVAAREPVYLMITYEGKVSGEQENGELIEFYDDLCTYFPDFVFGSLYAKYSDNDLKVDWVTLKEGKPLPANEQAFLPLDGRHWQTFLPIPRLWDWLYSRPHTFNDEIYRFVDFL